MSDDTSSSPAGKPGGRRRRRRRGKSGPGASSSSTESAKADDSSAGSSAPPTSGSGGGAGKGGGSKPAKAAKGDQPRVPVDDEKAIPIDQCAFAEYELREDLVKGLAATGYRTPSPIQAKSLPHAIEGRDVIGQARTGTGKTAAFLVPSLHQIDTSSPGVRALIVVPTRELAIQVASEADRLSRFMKGVRTLAVYGGDPMKRQLDELERDPKIIVATPGRLLDHLSRRTFKLDTLQMLVLDEADRMFDLGFREDIAKIMRHAPDRKQTLLYSATMSEEVLALSAQYMKDPARVFLAPDKMTVDEVDQSVFRVDRQFKTSLLIEVLKREAPDRSIIFTRTKIGADRLAVRLQKKGIEAHEIHSGLHQKKRETILKGFREGRFRFLIATDVAARGLDIPDVSHVINYDIPENPEDYVHRIGRTARMGKSGRAATFVTGDDFEFLNGIERLIKQQVPEMKYDNVKAFESQGDGDEKPKPKAPSYTRTLQGHIRKRTRR